MLVGDRAVRNPSLGLHRLPQPLHRRGPLLSAGEPRHPHRLAAAGLVRARGQPRTVPGQRQDLPRPRPEAGLLRLEHPPAAPRRGRSASRRPDRTLLRHGAGPIGSRGPRRPAAHAGPAEPGLDGLVGGRVTTSSPTAKPDSRPGSATSRAARSPATSTSSRCSGTSCSANAARSIAPSPTCGSTGSSSASIRNSAATGSKCVTIPSAELETVLLYSAGGRVPGRGPAASARRPCRAARRSVRRAKPQYNYLDLLIQKHEQSLATAQLRHRLPRGAGPRPAAAGRSPSSSNNWPPTLGRTGGLSAFRSDELETLQKVYTRLTATWTPTCWNRPGSRAAPAHPSGNRVPVTATP